MSDIFTQLQEAEQKQKADLKRLSERSTSQSSDQSTGQPTSQLTSQPTDVDIEGIGSVVPRPVAFYVTLKVDRWLDEAVGYLKSQGLHKADRSVVVNAILHDVELFSKMNLKKLRPKIMAHLTNKYLTKK